jgi:hypothetical protein
MVPETNMSKDELIKTSKGGSIFVDPKAKTISMDIHAKGEIDDLVEAFDLKTGSKPLPRLIYLGRNSGEYVILLDLDRLIENSVKFLRFHCSYCYARVAQGRLNSSVIDRIAACRCMAVLYRKDTRAARSSKEWSATRNVSLAGYVRHQAADTNGLS